jgi:hypothetical protein
MQLRGVRASMTVFGTFPGTAAGYVMEGNDDVRGVVLDIGNKVMRKGVESTSSRDRDLDHDPAVQALTQQVGSYGA